MSLITAFEAHSRDEAFDRADATSGHVSHAERVAFADAMMRPRPDEPICYSCGNRTGTIDRGEEDGLVCSDCAEYPNTSAVTDDREAAR